MNFIALNVKRSIFQSSNFSVAFHCSKSFFSWLGLFYNMVSLLFSLFSFFLCPKSPKSLNLFAPKIVGNDLKNFLGTLNWFLFNFKRRSEYFLKKRSKKYLILPAFCDIFYHFLKSAIILQKEKIFYFSENWWFRAIFISIVFTSFLSHLEIFGNLVGI